MHKRLRAIETTGPASKAMAILAAQEAHRIGVGVRAHTAAAERIVTDLARFYAECGTVADVAVLRSSVIGHALGSAGCLSAPLRHTAVIRTLCLCGGYHPDLRGTGVPPSPVRPQPGSAIQQH